MSTEEEAMDKVQQAIRKLEKKPRFHTGAKKGSFVGDHYHYKYYDIETKKYFTITKPELFELGNSLPLKVSEILNNLKKTHRIANPHENHLILKLCSLSISLWGGGPKEKLPFISMEEYQSQFYIFFIKAFVREGKSKWNPERSKWPRHVKWVRLDTIAYFAKLYNNQKLIIDATSERFFETQVGYEDSGFNPENDEEKNKERQFWDDFTEALHIRKTNDDELEALKNELKEKVSNGELSSKDAEIQIEDWKARHEINS